MTSQKDDPFFITPMRVLDLPEMTFFYVSNHPTEFVNLDRDLNPLLESIYAAKVQADMNGALPDIVRYYPEEGTGLYQMEVGISVPAETAPPGNARVKVLPACRCAAVILWGSLAHIGQTYETLMQAMKGAGLNHTGECRELTYSFESPDSPNNLMAVFMIVDSQP